MLFFLPIFALQSGISISTVSDEDSYHKYDVQTSFWLGLVGINNTEVSILMQKS